LLIADAFDERTRLAAGGSSCRVELWRLVLAPDGASLIREGPPAAKPRPPIEAFLPDDGRHRSRFRSRLRDGDL